MITQQQFRYNHTKEIWDAIVRGESDRWTYNSFAHSYVAATDTTSAHCMFTDEELDTAKEIISDLRNIYESTCVVVTTNTLDMRKLIETTATLKFRMQLAFEQYCMDKNINLE